MAWRFRSKVCCGQKWLFLLYPVFLLFLTISVMTMTLPLPLPPADVDRRSSRALSSTWEFHSRPRDLELPPTAAFEQPLTHTHAAGNDKYSIKERHHSVIRRNKYKGKGIASKRKTRAGADQHPTRNNHPNLPEFTVNNKEPKHIIKPGNHSSVVKHTAQKNIHLEGSKYTATHIPAPVHTLKSDRQASDRLAHLWEDGHRNRNADRQIHDSHTSAKLAERHKVLEKHRQHPGKSDKVSKEQQAVKKPFRHLKKHHNLSKEVSKERKKPGPFNRRKTLSKSDAALKKDYTGWCPSFTERDFSDSDHRRIRVSPDLRPLPWLSKDDILKMMLLAGGEVVSKAKVPAHGQVLQVALDPPANQQPSSKRSSPQYGTSHRQPETHSERCQQGNCALIKRTDDWFEVFAFHLDRVLGLNRSLPVVLRTFRSEILPYRYIRGSPRPVVWWDPDIRHVTNIDNDQNSVPLSWIQFQKLLQVHCGRETDLRSAPCVGIHHSEWGKLALFDFILQVNDRLDRYCCGFTPDPSELCVENQLYAKCGNTKNLLLVHILVRNSDPSKLVFIDNAGRPQQSNDNLNFRLVEGIDEFPETAVSVLQSGCLGSLLLRSLYTDKEFWDSQGGANGLQPLIHTVEHRGKILLQHIRDKKLQLKRDL